MYNVDRLMIVYTSRHLVSMGLLRCKWPLRTHVLTQAGARERVKPGCTTHHNEQSILYIINAHEGNKTSYWDIQSIWGIAPKKSSAFLKPHKYPFARFSDHQ